MEHLKGERTLGGLATFSATDWGTLLFQPLRAWEWFVAEGGRVQQATLEGEKKHPASSKQKKP